MLRLLPRYFTNEAFSPKTSVRREIFDKEFDCQLQSNSRRLEKITVECDHLSQKLTLTMNKNISSPLDCAKHIQEYLIGKSVLALVNGRLYDMSRPLTGNCELRFLDFHSDNCYQINMAFWRSCSFLTNWILENCFHDDFRINLCSFPSPNLKSGSFVCDVQIKYKNSADFDPNILKSLNLRSISNAARKLIFLNHNFIPLVVSQQVAETIFADSPLKLKQIPCIIENLEHKNLPSRISLYKVGDHVDICQGPLISSTCHIGRYKITAMFPIDSEDYGRLYRFQGIAIPHQLPTHHTTFDLLSHRAQQPNQSARIPELRRSLSERVLDVT